MKNFGDRRHRLGGLLVPSCSLVESKGHHGGGEGDAATFLKAGGTTITWCRNLLGKRWSWVPSRSLTASFPLKSYRDPINRKGWSSNYHISGADCETSWGSCKLNRWNFWFWACFVLKVILGRENSKRNVWEGWGCVFFSSMLGSQFFAIETGKLQHRHGNAMICTLCLCWFQKHQKWYS